VLCVVLCVMMNVKMIDCDGLVHGVGERESNEYKKTGGRRRIFEVFPQKIGWKEMGFLQGT